MDFLGHIWYARKSTTKEGEIMLACDCYFCIYQENGECKLSSVYINSFGVCDQVTFIDISEEALKACKESSVLVREQP